MRLPIFSVVYILAQLCVAPFGGNLVQIGQNQTSLEPNDAHSTSSTLACGGIVHLVIPAEKNIYVILKKSMWPISRIMKL